MTTLRSFQEEIDKVRSVEIQKLRAKVAQEREGTKIALKAKDTEHRPSNRGEEDAKVLNKGKSKYDVKPTTAQAKEEKHVESDAKEEVTSPVEDNRLAVLDTSETEEKIQVCLTLYHVASYPHPYIRRGFSFLLLQAIMMQLEILSQVY